MSIVIGVDLGTTTITAVAAEIETGQLVGCATRPTPAPTTSATDRAAGRSEFDIHSIIKKFCECIRDLANQLGVRLVQVAGVGLTGQQHGMVLIDERLDALSPFINWQDQRGDEPFPETNRTVVEQARHLLGDEAPGRTGCKLATGYMGSTLFWLKTLGRLPPRARACFVTDYAGAFLTSQSPVTDPTMAASSGMFNIKAGKWDDELLAALGLPLSCFPVVRESGSILGKISEIAAKATGLPPGVPVCLGIGDNQASFLGSVMDRAHAVLVNVGTGGQVSVYRRDFAFHPKLETRPFPRGGYLLVSAGLCGGRSYALLEQFFRAVGKEICGIENASAVYAAMNRLAATVPSGAAGLCCEPFFTGTRAEPARRGMFSGISPQNFSPAHFARALLEGMAHAFRTSFDLIAEQADSTVNHLVCAGNGMRENPLLVQLVADAFRMPFTMPPHREEAAYGAARIAAVELGLSSL
jgi:sugar (pentulose or hexulose) kinase